MKEIIVLLFVVLLFIISLSNPESQQGLIFPIAILIYIYRERIKPFFSQIPLSVAFILLGLFFGLLTEGFAILSNLSIPPEEKILLHANPFLDLILGVFYYSMFIGTWYLLLRKIKFSKKSVFIISGIFGIITEQSGGVLFGIVANPLFGSFMALLVMFIYGIFPYLAYMLTEKAFPERKKSKIYHFILALIALMIFWAIYGNFIHAPFIESFPSPNSSFVPS